MDKAMMILAHGSKVEATRDVAFKIRDDVKTKGIYADVKVAFLQFNKPDIREVALDIYGKGIRHIVAAPMFLFEGNHIKYDIPEEFKKIKQLCPGLTVEISKPLGYDERIAQIIVERAEGELCAL
jgi:sirohydrochlorin cobaltochelatase